MHTKKTILTTLCLCVFLFIGLTAIAQTRIIDLDNDGRGYEEIHLDANKNAVITSPILYAVNLDSDPSNSNTAAVLPSNTAPIYLEFSYEGNNTLIPSSSFTFKDIVNGHERYQMAPVQITVNFSDLCQASPTDLTLINYTWRLVDQFGNDYPIHDSPYSDPTGIFSCQVFDETCNDCNKNCSGELFTSVVIESTVNIVCGAKLFNNPTFGANEKQTKHFFSTLTLTLTPNPFQNHLQLEYKIESPGRVNLTIYNSQGQMMFNISNIEEAGIYRKTIDTDKWSNGIYYGKIQSGNQSSFVKIFKVES